MGFRFLNFGAALSLVGMLLKLPGAYLMGGTALPAWLGV